MSDGTFKGRWMSEVFRTVLVSPEVKVLLLAMAVNMDDSGHYSVPRDELASTVGCHPRKVTDKQKTAIDAGLLSRTRAGSRGNTAEFRAEVPGVDRGPTTSTLSDDDRGPTTSTQSSDWVPTVGTQSAGKGADCRPPTTYTHTEQDETADPAVVVPLFDENNDQEEKTHTARNRAGDRFDEFWAAYPRKIAKGAARKAWAKALKNGTDPEQIIWGARAYASNPRRSAADIQYTAHPATWLNAERWDDDAEEAPPAARSTTNERVAQGQAVKERIRSGEFTPLRDLIRQRRTQDNP